MAEGGIEQMRALAKTSRCFDCLSLLGDPWLSLNLGIFLCIRCSGIHRSLGVHISKVRSISLDKISEKEADHFCKVFTPFLSPSPFLSRIPPFWTPPSSQQLQITENIKEWIRIKYEYKWFAKDQSEGMCLVGLPEIVWLRIMSFLPISDLFSLTSTCKRMGFLRSHMFKSLTQRFSPAKTPGCFCSSLEHQQWSDRFFGICELFRKTKNVFEVEKLELRVCVLRPGGVVSMDGFNEVPCPPVLASGFKIPVQQLISDQGTSLEIHFEVQEGEKWGGMNEKELQINFAEDQWKKVMPHLLLLIGDPLPSISQSDSPYKSYALPPRLRALGNVQIVRLLASDEPNQVVKKCEEVILLPPNLSPEKILELLGNALITRVASEKWTCVTRPGVWVADSDSKSCLVCNSLFTPLKRRHHCRCCGILCCDTCSPFTMELGHLSRDLGGFHRVCVDCYINFKPVLKEFHPGLRTCPI